MQRRAAQDRFGRRNDCSDFHASRSQRYRRRSDVRRRGSQRLPNDSFSRIRQLEIHAIGSALVGTWIDCAAKPSMKSSSRCFQAPHSYTGEDVVEISAHGNPLILGRIVETARSAARGLPRPANLPCAPSRMERWI